MALDPVWRVVAAVGDGSRLFHFEPIQSLLTFRVSVIFDISH